MLLKLAGVVIAHSIIQGGPRFSVLSPAVYFQLAGADPDKVLSNLRKTDLPLNAGMAIYLHENENVNISEFCMKSFALGVTLKQRRKTLVCSMLYCSIEIRMQLD